MSFGHLITIAALLGLSRLISASAPQEALPALRDRIVVGDLQFRVVRVAFERTAMGFVPEDMGPDDRLMFVEFDLVAGDREDFKNLKILVVDGSGRKRKAVALAEGGAMKLLSPMTLKRTSSEYRPSGAGIAWGYVVPAAGKAPSLRFPTGETISLAPWLGDGTTRAP